MENQIDVSRTSWEFEGVSNLRETRPKAIVDVFRYDDYRRFLADFYLAKKARGFSYRTFAKSVGLGAPNYLRLVIENKRNLSQPMAVRFAKACELNNEASRYFTALVAFNQAKTQAEKEAAFERLKGFRRYRRAQKVQLAEADYHSTWYTPAIRELVRCRGFRNDPDWIASILRPAVRPSQVKHALEVLQRLGLLSVSAEGRLQQASDIVSTGAESSGMHIRSYHAEMMRQAIAAMEGVPREERDISSLTLSVGSKGLLRLKQRLQELRLELLDMGESDPEPQQVVQLNFQLFPLSYPLRKSADFNTGSAVAGPQKTRGKR